ncbi:MAG: hypothetical protein J6V11_00410, partial [Alphaproteobacteria bacterium]|nr:hypothetical protein [Alphaproteobacteria bacterium]
MLGDNLEKAQEFGLLDKEGHLVFGDTGTLLTNNLMPKGALTQAWWSAEGGSVFKKFYDNVKLWARWALVYGPIAGIGKDLLLKSMEESQTKEALEQTNDPEWTETWNNLVKNQEPAPTDPFHQELAAMKMEKDPAFDILNREADIFITPFLLAFAGSDKLFGTHLLDMKMYEQMQEAKRLLSKPKIIMDVLHNTHKVMRKDIYLSNIAETRAILKSSKFITQNGSVPEAEILFAQDLKAMYDELDKWEEAFNNVQGDSPAQIQQLDSLFLGDHSDKLNKLMDIYGYKCLLQRYKNEALDIEAERTSGISQDIKLVRKMDVCQNAFQTLDSWKNSIDSLTEKELGQKANDLLRNVDTTLQQIGNSTAEDIISSVDSQPFQKQGDVFIAAGKFSIEATGDYYQRSLEYVFDKKSDAAPFINDVKNLTKQCLEELENMKKEAVSDAKDLKKLRENINLLRINLKDKLGTVWNNATEHIQERYPLSAAMNTFENIGWQYKENLAQILGESKAAPFVNEIQNLVTQYANQVQKMGAEPVLNDKTLAHLKAKTNDLTQNLTKDLNNVRARAMDQFYKEHPSSAD